MHRLLRVLRRDGLVATTKRIAGLVVRDEVHIWYALDLAGDVPRRELGDGLLLVRAHEEDTPGLEELTQLPAAAAAARLADGAELWLVRDGATPAFACWIFRRETPVFAAPRGTLRLPERTVCLEDSVTASTHRGRGIAPAAWAAVADVLRGEGVRRMITKVAVDNVPSRRAVEKVGFTEAATMTMHLRGRARHVGVTGDSELARYLAHELSAEGAQPPP